MAYFKKSEVRTNLTPNQVRQEYPDQARSTSEHSGLDTAGLRSGSNTSFGAGGGSGSVTSPQQPNHRQFYPDPGAGGQGAGYGDDSPSMLFGSEGTRTNSQYDWWSADSPSVQQGNWKDQQNPTSFTTSASGGSGPSGGGGKPVGLPTNRSTAAALANPQQQQQQQQNVGGIASNGRVSGSNSAKFKMPKMNPLFDPSADDEDPFSNLPPPPPPPPQDNDDGGGLMGDPLASASPGEDPFAGIDDHQPPPASSSSPNFGTYEQNDDDTAAAGGAGAGAGGDDESWEGWYQADDGYWYKKADDDIYDPYTQEATTPRQTTEEDDDGEFLESVLGDSIAGAGSDYQGSPKNPLRQGSSADALASVNSGNMTKKSPSPPNDNTSSNNPTPTSGGAVDHHHPPRLSEQQISTNTMSSGSPSTKPPISPASLAGIATKQDSSNLGGGGLSATKTPTNSAGTPGTAPPASNGSFLSPASPYGMNGSMVSNSSDTAGSPRFGRPPLRQGSSSSTGVPDQKIRFRKIKELGKGAFGEVFLAMNILTGALMAVKQIRLDDQTAGSKLVRDVEREINIMATLPEHPNVVRYFGSQQGNKCQHIMMEVVSGGSVESLLRATKRRFHEATIQQYAFMVLLGLQHLHQHNIVHQDIKGANVLIDNAGLAKIADFGCCKDLGAMHMNSSKTAGSPLFMAPEVCRGAPADTRSDIWSFGCFLLEMAKDDRRPWSGFGKEMSLYAIIYAISSATEPPEIPSYLSPVCQDFILKCLCIDPAARATPDELLSHQFFAEDSIFDMDVLEQMHSEVEFTPDHSPQRGAGGQVFSKSQDSLSDVRQDSATFVRSTPMSLPNTKDSASPLLESGKAGGGGGAGRGGVKSTIGGGAVRGGGAHAAPEEESQQLYQFSLGSAKSTYNDTYTPVGLRSLNPSGSAIKRQIPGVGIPASPPSAGGGEVSNGSGVLNVPPMSNDSIPTIKPRGEGPVPYSAANSVEQGPLVYHFQGGGAVNEGRGGAPTTGPSQLNNNSSFQQEQQQPLHGSTTTTKARPSPNNQLALVEYVSNSAHKRQKGRSGKASKNGGVLDALVNKFKCIGQ